MTKPHSPTEPHELLAENDDSVIGPAFFWSLGVIIVVAAAIGLTLLAVRFRPQSPPTIAAAKVEPPKVRAAPVGPLPKVAFTDITRSAGIDFVHVNGAYGEKLLPETMGGGVAFFDFDNDGDQDLLLVNSTHWPWRHTNGGAAKPTLALYRNDTTADGVRFTDVTAGSGLDVSLYGMGAAVGDVDNDGLPDVFITCVGEPEEGLDGRNRLFRNLGDGRFSDSASSAGGGGEPGQWSSSAAFFDADNDGDLDLFVCNYVKWNRESDIAQNFQLVGVGRAYGPPIAFAGSFAYLYRNDTPTSGAGASGGAGPSGGASPAALGANPGAGPGANPGAAIRFTDVSSQAGVQVTNSATGAPVAKSLGVMPIDLDGDHAMDLIVANDTVRNFVLHNRGDGRFEEIGELTGVAYNSDGAARGAMGIDAAHFRNNAALGIAIGNFANEMTALYVSHPSPASGGGAAAANARRSLLFTDDAIATGLGPPSRLDLTFGMFFFDYDLDGRLDLLGVNGHLESEINQVQSSQHYRQPARLFWNAGADQRSEFVSVSAGQAGEDLFTPIVGRGSAYADIDGDGDLDVIITQVAGPPVLLRNDQSLGRRSVTVLPVGTASNRDAIGAIVELTLADGTVMRRHVNPTRGYLSQSQRAVTFGLGESGEIASARVIWPGGREQTIDPAALRAGGVVPVTER